MSKTSRRAKRTSRSMYRQMDKLMRMLLELKDVFTKDHPEMGAVVEQCAVGINLSQDLLVMLYVAAWGTEPSDWYRDA